MTKKEAHNYLYALWENGIVPSNFTEEHSEYSRGIEQVMKLGHLIFEDFF